MSYYYYAKISIIIYLNIKKDAKDIKEYIKNNNLKEICIFINKKLKNKSISIKTLKRFFKKITFPTR